MAVRKVSTQARVHRRGAVVTYTAWLCEHECAPDDVANGLCPRCAPKVDAAREAERASDEYTDAAVVAVRSAV